MDPLEKITLDGLEKFTYISSLLYNEEMEQLRLMLLNNIDVFAWSHSDIIRINLKGGLSQTKYYPRGQTNKTESEVFPPRSPSDHLDESRQLAEGRFNQRSEVPRMASQRGGCSKEMG